MFKHILVPLDESKLSERALDYAREVVARDGKITLIYVLDLENEPFNRYNVTEGELQQKNIREHAISYLEDTAHTLRAVNIETHPHVEMGKPADRIVEFVRTNNDVDLVVMSTHGRSGISRWLMGSVTQKVLGATRCPVFVIPPEERGQKQKK